MKAVTHRRKKNEERFPSQILTRVLTATHGERFEAPESLGIDQRMAII